MATCPNQFRIAGSYTYRCEPRRRRSALVECLRHPWRRRCPILMAPLAGALVVAGFVAYERIGTHANISVMKYADETRGGFLTVGYSETQPGILVASALNRDDVWIGTQQTSYWLAGTHTDVDIVTPHASWHRRLRGPLVVTIDASGEIATTKVDWSAHALRTIAEAADCHELSTLVEKHCGSPFVDVRARTDKWPTGTVPPNLRTFLADAR